MLTSKNIRQEIEKVASLAEEYSYNFVFELIGHSCNGYPEMYIMINDTVYYAEKVNKFKKYYIDTFIPKDSQCQIVIGMKNKDPNQNTIIENGKIKEDQYIKINDIQINNISLIKNNLYFYDFVQFNKHDSNEVLYKTDGLWHNGELSLSLPTPIFPFLSKIFQEKSGNAFKNKSISSEQIQELIQTVFD